MGHIIGRLTADDLDSEDDGLIQFRILPNSLPMAEFLINGITGDIIVNKQIDYEQSSFIEFIVELSDSGSPCLKSQEKIIIHVIDINDNIPVIINNIKTFKLSESALIGQIIHQFQISDLDGTEDNRLSLFSLANDYSSTFDILPLSGQLIVASDSLDFELTKSYNLTIQATNIAGGDVVEVWIEIQLKDENDEAPRFINGCPVHFEMFENTAPAIVGATVADDEDDGDNGLIAYSIVEGNMTLFSVNSASGIITSLVPMDREESSKHSLKIQVTDSGRPRLSAICDVIITILDDNDNIPIFNQPYYQVGTDENASNGTLLTTIFAEDADFEDNGRITYRILSPETVPFIIDPNNGNIYTIGLIDREITSYYDLIIEASDHGRYHRKTNIIHVYIHVNDLNDNSPIIRNSQLDVFIPSTLKTGEVVHVIDAYDPDLNDKLTFTLSGPDASSFSINDNGELILQKIWISSKSYYSITVTVNDNNDQNTSASFTYYIQDIDMFPRFITSTPKIVIREHQSSTVFRFEAKPTQTSSGSVLYSILGGNGDDVFEINTVSGQLKSRITLDRERKSSYRLWIQATNTEIPPKSSWQSIDIIVDDVNDNAPIFKKVVYDVDIEENTLTKDALLSVQATDSDSGNNGNITYSIINGNRAGIFSIDESSGAIYCHEQLDRESRAMHTLTIMASDQGTPSLNATALVQIHVLDVDDNSPRFTRIFYREISEDTEVGTEVLQIIATDVDATENYTFILDNYNDIFKINTKTGMITTLKTLDRETKSAYRLMIRVDDGSWTIQTNAMITISDMNDNAPIFAKDEYFFLINDNSLKNLTNGGYIIGYINASDRDIGDNGRIRYHLYSDNSYVTIHPSTGELRLIRYPSDLIQIMVVATDNGNPEQSTNCSVVILWQPIASARPQQSVLAFKSSLNQTVIGKLDDVYKIIALYPKNIIQIDNNYSIYILSNMNITISNQTLIHILTISIYNELIYQPLELLISDTIFKPIFKENRTHITVSESAPIGSEIISLDASNGNPLLKQTLQYSILNSNNKAFRITSSGVILVASSTEIDYERNKNHHLKIEASAGGYNSLLDLHIDILDDNDNSPEFVTKLKPFISFSQKDSLCLNAYDADSEPLSHTEFVTNSEDVLLDSETGCMSVVSSSNISERFYVIVSALNGEYHHTNCLIDIIYIPSIYTNQFIKSTKEEIVRKDVCSAAPNGTIILKSTIQSSFAVLPSSEVHLNIDHRVIFWSGRHHEPFAPSERMNVWELTQYGRFAKHFQLDIHLNPLVAPAPVFDKDYYEMDVATPVKNGFIIHNFHWILPADCHVELSSDTSFSPPICLSSDGLLTVCGQVTLPFYQVTLKIFQGNSIVSLTNTIIRFKSTSWKSVLLNTNFRVAYIRENSNPQQILRIHNNNELKNIRFNITNTNMAKIFSISNDGILYTQHKLDRERRAVYRIPIEISYQPSFTKMIEVGVIVDDEVDSTDSLDSYDVRIFAASNHEIYADVHPSTIDISKQYRCLSINQPKHSVNSSCYLHLTSNSDNNSSLSLMASDGQMPYKYTVYWNHIETPDEYSSNLLNNSIALTLFGPDDGVADLLTTLRRNLPDFTVIPLIVSKANSLNRTIVFAVKDRNQNLLMSKDSLPIFQRFSEKNILSSIDIQSVWPVSLLCQNTQSPCSGSLQCQPFTKFNNQSMLLRGQTEIWSIREGSLNIKCECVKSNGCSSSILPKLVVLTDSLDSDVTVAPIATKTMPKVATSCSNYDCGNHGRCIETSENTLMCHCDGGFTATYCDLENSAISLVSSDHIIMKPTISLRQLSDVVIPSQRLTTTGMPSSKDCNDGRQLIEMDFKTTTDDVLPLLTLDYGDVRAVVQLRHSQLVYMVTDGYRNPIEIVLSQIVSDGQFHTFSLQLSPDRKMMTFQVDGVGKEARSMKPMPNLISSSIKNILIGSASKKTIDSIVCVRKLLINRQLQVLQMNQHFASYQYFLPTTVGTVRSCSKTSGTPVKPITHSSTTSSTSSASSTLNPGLLATLIGIGGLTGCAFVTLGIWKVWSILTTDSCPTAPSGGWKPATEFRAFPKHKDSQLEVPSNQISSTSICSSLKMTTASSGHFNNAMALSVASLSTSDDGYEVPIQNYVENFNHMISANCNRNSYSKPTYNSYF